MPSSEATETVDADRRAQGLAVYHQVYGPNAVTFDPGQADFFDLMMVQLFGEVWSRPALAIDARRLLVMGVLAAQHRFETLGLQFLRTLENGELDADQVREVVIQLIPYVGYPSSGDLYRVAETAIATHLGGAA
jgi:4-carboxymuconolactone decarboxylase